MISLARPATRLLKPIAFVRRDFLIAISYRLGFVLQLGGILLSTMMLFFLSRLVGGGMSGQLQPYGGDYFAFVITGIALTDYLAVSLGSFATEIRNAQILGTLEAMLVSPTSVPTILFSSSLYSYCFTSIRVLLYLGFGMLLFGLELKVTSPVSLIVLFLLTILCFSGLGLLSAAFIIIFKQGNPMSWLVSASSGLLGGVLYPVSVLPAWLKPFATLLPVTHALEAIRQVILNGATLWAVWGEVLILLLFTLLLLPLGLSAFLYALSVARREGSLVHY